MERTMFMNGIVSQNECIMMNMHTRMGREERRRLILNHLKLLAHPTVSTMIVPIHVMINTILNTTAESITRTTIREDNNQTTMQAAHEQLEVEAAVLIMTGRTQEMIVIIRDTMSMTITTKDHLGLEADQHRLDW